jgi:hypothetical protein
MIKSKGIRLLLGTILGGFAGLSMTSSVLPTVLAMMGIGDSIFNRWILADYAAHSTLVWAVGGWAVVKMDNPKFGSLILGLVGAVSGALLMYVGFGQDQQQVELMLAGGVTGAGYGAIGGLLLGTVLRGPGEPADPPAET